MLPPEIGAERAGAAEHRPDGRHHGLPLREARDLFETQYLAGAVAAVWRQYFADRAVRRDGAQSALHRKLKQFGVNSDERVGG